ncbi:MAG TPA: endo alpha-1,4 polygalactosaminidase, partial [Dehalococcoidales bacterium]|nr:endo alpha-1,4 polygalactosaminidase [Dehalococcoidales bacterium]
MVFIITVILIPVGFISNAAAAGSWWQPTAANPIHWQWQIGTPFNTSSDIIPNVTVYDLDGFDTSAATVATLHSLGCKVIAYFSFGTSENWRPDYSLFTASIKGQTNGWAGENWIDIRSDAVKSIMSARMDLAVSKGFDGLEPDNIDGYSNSTGFPLTAQDQLNFNEWIATTAHSKGLSVGLKNDVDQVTTLQPYFDWMLDEESYKYSEYDTLQPFVNANKAVFEVEYGTNTPQATTMNGLHMNSMTRDLDLVAPGGSGYVRIPCIPDTQNTWNVTTQTPGTTVTTSSTSVRPT